MAASDLAGTSLRRAARRAYELGRLDGAVARGTVAAGLAMPGFLICDHAPFAAACLAGFALVVAAGRMVGGDFETGARSGAVAGILPCLLPAALRAIDPDFCAMVSSRGPWICAIGGVAAGAIVAMSGRRHEGPRFWGTALVTLGLAAALGCIPAGLAGFFGLTLGVVAGGAPVLAARRAAA